MYERRKEQGRQGVPVVRQEEVLVRREGQRKRPAGWRGVGRGGNRGLRRQRQGLKVAGQVKGMDEREGWLEVCREDDRKKRDQGTRKRKRRSKREEKK